MDIPFDTISSSAAYFTLTQTVMPRPVAWVLSEHKNGEHNLAPFSFFSVVCSDPPVIMISVGHKPDGSLKDTYRNIVERNNFVVHLAHSGQAQKMTQTSKTLPEGVSEVKEAGIVLTPFNNSPLPRIAGCRVAIDCELYETREIGNAPQFLIFGKVRNMFIDDAIVSVNDKGRLNVDARMLDPLGRLGGADYLSFGDIISVPRES
ncbi:MAG: flavin reductase family protein [Oceanospirillales bacterium]|nr:flavin reductase family protein [Oceanospirillales bacterium]MBR9889390.1 flavin reductase family protein [Oceanospirillales bacterium]